ncbi:MAG: hypothetical protein Q8885_02505 [Candidatus Phytoplasma stylosanthis]|nr:hypothetical protein [Candidatus Phytoplasma stylosanthis]
MNQTNFFQKNWLLIFIFIGIGIVGCYFWFQNQKEKETTLLSEPESPSETLQPNETPAPARPKRSMELNQPKIKTTAARLEKIKNYLFTENSNLSYLPSDLLEQEKEEINKLKNSYKYYLELLEKDKNKINEEQKKCDEHKNQLALIKLQIDSKKSQLSSLEQQKDEKKEEINILKIGRTDNNEDKIEKLQDEIKKIIQKIVDVEIQIKDLEETQEKYQELLYGVAGSENFKKMLEEQYNGNQLEYKNDILNSLNNLYDIV